MKQKEEMVVVDAFEVLPNELVSLILVHHLPPIWQHVCKSVCQRWRLLLLQPNRSPRSPFSDSRLQAGRYAGELALGGHLEVLQWARSQGCPWDEWTCACAALGGHLEVLQWLRSQACPWNKQTCVNAAFRGHLEMLQWARAQGCPWDEWTCAAAALGGRFEVLQWLRSQGCPEQHVSVTQLLEAIWRCCDG